MEGSPLPISRVPSHLDAPPGRCGPRSSALPRAGDGDSGPFSPASGCGTRGPAPGPGGAGRGGAGAGRATGEGRGPSPPRDDKDGEGRGGGGAARLGWAAHTRLPEPGPGRCVLPSLPGDCAPLELLLAGPAVLKGPATPRSRRGGEHREGDGSVGDAEVGVGASVAPGLGVGDERPT